MIAVNNEPLDDNYNDKHTYLSLTGESFTLFVFNNPASAILLKRSPRGGQNFAPMPEISISPGSVTIQNAVGIQLRNSVAGSQARIFLTAPEFDPGSPDPVLLGYTPTTAKVSASGGVSTAPSVPIGGVIAWGGATAPATYLLCDGSAVSRTTYADLFSVIGTTYGAGDGSTTFNVPDLRGRVVVGVGTNASVNARGLNDGVAVANRRAQHKHTVTDPTHTHASPTIKDAGAVIGNLQVGNSTGNWGTVNMAGAATGISVGAAADALDAPAWMTFNYIIASGV